MAQSQRMTRRRFFVANAGPHWKSGLPTWHVVDGQTVASVRLFDMDRVADWAARLNAGEDVPEANMRSRADD